MEEVINGKNENEIQLAWKMRQAGWQYGYWEQENWKAYDKVVR